MSYLNFLTPVAAGDNDFVKFAKLQAQARQACVNAGVTIPMGNPLLDDVRSGDSELQKFQKVNAWLSLLSGSSGQITWSTPPAAANSPGTTGQVSYDGSYFYVCTATNTWIRAVLMSW